MPLDFPTSPALNQLYTFNGKTWKWDGAGWESYNVVISGGGFGGISGPYVISINGITGGVTLYAGTGINIQTSINGITFVNTGILGTTGNTGNTGPTGPTGSIGPTGARGTTGNTGATGPLPEMYVTSINGVTGIITFSTTNFTINNIGKNFEFVGLGSLTEVPDVRIGGAVNYDVLYYDQTNSLFKFNAVSALLGNYLKTFNGYTAGITLFAGEGLTLQQSNIGFTLSINIVDGGTY